MSTFNKYEQFPPGLQLFTMSEVAIILGVSNRLVNQWITDGNLPVFRLGSDSRIIRIRRVDLDEFIETHIRKQNGEVSKSIREEHNT